MNLISSLTCDALNTIDYSQYQFFFNISSVARHLAYRPLKKI